MCSLTMQVDISGVKVDDKLNDDYFKRPAQNNKASGEYFDDKKEVCV